MTIPLSKAYLCEDCNCIDSNAVSCPNCASGALMGLAAVLNRDTSTSSVEVDLMRRILSCDETEAPELAYSR